MHKILRSTLFFCVLNLKVGATAIDVNFGSTGIHLEKRVSRVQHHFRMCHTPTRGTCHSHSHGRDPTQLTIN